LFLKNLKSGGKKKHVRKFRPWRAHIYII